MKIAYFITSFGIGGAETQVSLLARAMQRRHHEVAVVRLVDTQYDAFPRLFDLGITCLSLHLNRGWHLPNAFLRARAWGKTWKPDIVHCHQVHANIFGRLLRLVLDIPVLLSTAHSTNEGGRVRMWAYRATDPLTDLTTNVSPEAVDAFVRKGACPASRVRYIANGVDPECFKPDSEARTRSRRELNVGNRFLFLAVSNLFKVKDYPTLINAFSHIQCLPEKPLLVIAGDGPERQDIEGLIRSFSLGDAVRLLGRRDDIADLLNAADCFVMSSVREGAPMVLIEAMSSGKQIVCTEFGGASSLLGDAGTIVPKSNPQFLASAMMAMVNIGNTFNQAAIDRTKALYSIDAIANTWENLYRDFSVRPSAFRM